MVLRDAPLKQLMEVYAKRRDPRSSASDYRFMFQDHEIQEDETPDDVGLRPESCTFTPAIDVERRGNGAALAKAGAGLGGSTLEELD